MIIIGKNFGLSLEGGLRYGKFVSAVYIVNVLIQGFFSLACPMGLGLLVAWLLVDKGGAPVFWYPVLIVLGAILGLYSMIKFIIDTMTAVERIEKQREEKERKK